MEKSLLTQEGYDKLYEELNFLKTTKRREAADALEKARAHGDLKENAEYDAAKEAKAHLETRIQTIEMTLANARIIDPSEMPTDTVCIGMTVDIKNVDTGDTFQYTLVGPDEANFEEGKIATTSPIGKALIGKAVGEIAEADIPAGKVKFEVLKLSLG